LAGGKVVKVWVGYTKASFTVRLPDETYRLEAYDFRGRKLGGTSSGRLEWTLKPREVS